MKLFFLLFLLGVLTNVFSQSSKKWSTIDSLISVERYKTAARKIDSLERIEASSQKDTLLCQFYRFRLLKYQGEAQFDTFRVQLENQIANTSGNTKAVLYSLLGELYWSSYLQNRESIDLRSSASHNISFMNWDRAFFFREIDKCYSNSVQEPEVLSTKSLKYFSFLLLEKKESEFLPSLYELLISRALNFYESSYFIQYEDVMSDSSFYSGSSEFIKKDLSKEKTSYRLKALKLYQKILEKHIANQNRDVLIYWDIRRLQYVKSILNVTGNQEAYLNAITGLVRSNDQVAYAAYGAFLIADYLAKMGGLYAVNQDSTYLYKSQEALKWCQWVIDKGFDEDNVGRKNLELLKKEILSKSCDLKMEQYQMPHKRILANLSFKNIDKIYLRVLATSNTELDKLKTLSRPYYTVSTDELISHFKKKNPQYLMSIELPVTSFHQKHSTELSLKGLPIGDYVVLVGTSEDLSVKNDDVVGYAQIKVTNVVYQTRQDDRRLEVQVLNRVTGFPLEGAIIQSYNEVFDPATRLYKKQVATRYITGELGNIYVYSQENKDFGNTYFKIIYKKDTLYSDKFYLSKSNKEVKDSVVKLNLFTDRVIYKPGQNVFFKGVAFYGKDSKYRVIKDLKQKIELVNVNNVIVDSVTLTTNEFGSFKGSFVIPPKLSTGNFLIRSQYAKKVIQVEKYKRPTFFVELNKQDVPPSFNQKISVKGLVKNFSGTPETRANVSYRIRRILKSFSRKDLQYKTEASVLEEGSLQTDESGQFFIGFETKPDISYDISEEPVFVYEVRIIVINLDGEKQEIIKNFEVGYNNRLISHNIPEIIDISKDSVRYSVFCSDRNEIVYPDSLSIRIVHLEENERPYHNRLWKVPELVTIPEKNFKKAFPFFAFKNEKHFKNWNDLETVLDTTLPSGINQISLKNLEEVDKGVYKILFYSGEQEVDCHYVTLYSSESSDVPYPTIFFGSFSSDTVNVGETFTFNLGSSVKGKALVQIERRGEIVEKKWVQLKNEIKQFTYDILEQHEGKLNVYLTFYYRNRSYNEQHQLIVPVLDKELDLRLTTFKNLTQPGTKEKWSVSLVDKNIPSDQTELLVSIYDKSLDAISKKSNIFKLNLYTFNYPMHKWRSFGANQVSNFKKGIGHAQPKFYHHSEPHFFTYESSHELIDNLMRESNLFTEKSDFANTPRYRYVDLREDKVSTSNVTRSFIETSCFLPQIKANKVGSFDFEFFVPDQLTTWKFTALAHSKTGDVGVLSKDFVVKKDLIVKANRLNYLRAGDLVDYDVTVINLSKDKLNGDVIVNIIDSETGIDVTSSFIKGSALQEFFIEAESSKIVSWQLAPVDDIYSIELIVSAQSKLHRDVKKHNIPILSRKELVTDHMSFILDKKGDASFSLKELNKSTLSSAQKLVFEYTSNPYWYAVLALPSLYNLRGDNIYVPYAKLNAALMAKYVLASNPRIKSVLDDWKKSEVSDRGVFEKDRKLLDAVIEETPWVLDVHVNQLDKKRVLDLLDEEKLDTRIKTSWAQVVSMQLNNGAFEWYDEMGEDLEITASLIIGLEKMSKLDSSLVRLKGFKKVLDNGLNFLDMEMLKRYNQMSKENSQDTLPDATNHLTEEVVKYLYIRTAYQYDDRSKSELKEMYGFWLNQSRSFWESQGVLSKIYLIGVFAMLDDKGLSNEIFGGLEAELVDSKSGKTFDLEELRNRLQANARMVSLADKFGHNVTANGLRKYLLKHKKFNDWGSVIVNGELIYSILVDSDSWVITNEVPVIKLGGNLIDPKTDSLVGLEVGTGYYSLNLNKNQIRADMGKLLVKKKTNDLSAGAMYFMHDKLADALSDQNKLVKVTKRIFKEESGKRLNVNEGMIKKGDKLIVQLDLEIGHDMAFVNLIDQKASCLKPLENGSNMAKQSGVPFYQSNKKTTVGFYFRNLPKGNYTIEYGVYVANSGEFNSGVAKVKSNYSPDYSGVSNSVKLKVTK